MPKKWNDVVRFRSAGAFYQPLAEPLEERGKHLPPEPEEICVAERRRHLLDPPPVDPAGKVRLHLARTCGKQQRGVAVFDRFDPTIDRAIGARMAQHNRGLVERRIIHPGDFFHVGLGKGQVAAAARRVLSGPSDRDTLQGGASALRSDERRLEGALRAAGDEGVQRGYCMRPSITRCLSSGKG